MSLLRADYPTPSTVMWMPATYGMLTVLRVVLSLWRARKHSRST